MVGRQTLQGAVPEPAEDEDDRPEEVTLKSGREEAEGRRKTEQASKRRVAAEAKQKRRKWSEGNKDKPHSEGGGTNLEVVNSEAPQKDAGKSVAERPQVEATPPTVGTSGFLQADVVEFLANRERSRVSAAAEASKDLRPAAGVTQKKGGKRSNTSVDRNSQAKRVRVVVLNESFGNGVARSAQDFRRNRLFGSHLRRSVDMLIPRRQQQPDESDFDSDSESESDFDSEFDSDPDDQKDSNDRKDSNDKKSPDDVKGPDNEKGPDNGKGPDEQKAPPDEPRGPDDQKGPDEQKGPDGPKGPDEQKGPDGPKGPDDRKVPGDRKGPDDRKGKRKTRKLVKS